MSARRTVRALLVPQHKERDERGAVAIMVGILTILLVGVCSLAVDIGYQRVAKRDMQAIADIVAMDMARLLDGSSISALTGGAWNTALANSVARNQGDAVGEPLTVVSCPSNDSKEPGSICAQPGVMVDGEFQGLQPSLGHLPATHVRVRVRTTIDYFFPIYGDGGQVNATAIATARDGACYRIGSYVARADLNNGLLGPVLDLVGAKLSLSAGDMGKLLDTDVSLLSLVGADIEGVSVDQLLGTDVSLAGYYLAVADAAQASGADTATVALLEALALKVPGQTVNLANVLAIDTAGEVGADVMVNALDLVSFGLVAANGEGGLKLQDLSAAGGVTGSVSVVQKPQIGCGKSGDPANVAVETSQVHANVKITGQELAGPVVGLVEGLLSATVCLLGLACHAEIELDGEIDVSVVPASAKLTGVDCLGDRRTVYFETQGGDLIKVVADLTARVAMVGNLSGNTLLGIDVDIPVSTVNPNRPVTTTTINIENDGDYEIPATIGVDSLGVPGLFLNGSPVATVTLGSIGIELGSLANMLVAPVLGIVNPLLQGLLDATVLSPIVNALGLDVAGAEIYALKTPACGYPALRG